MRFFQRKKREPKLCPQCHQLLEPDALECDMCGFDMRDLQPAGQQASREQAGSAYPKARH
jgi:hypothetical protein